MAIVAEAQPVPHVKDGEYPNGEHPLETSWTLWVDKKGGDRKAHSAYMEGLKQVGTFNTIEGFMKLYNHLKRPSQFPREYNLMCFRTGLAPMWEEFPDGGCWNYRLRRGQESDEYVNYCWESALIACLSEVFETPCLVGCVLSSRIKDIAISVWNASNTADPQVRFKIGEKVREVMHLSPNSLLEYKDHQSSLKDFSTFRNARKYIMRSDD